MQKLSSGLKITFSKIFILLHIFFITPRESVYASSWIPNNAEFISSTNFYTTNKLYANSNHKKSQYSRSIYYDERIGKKFYSVGFIINAHNYDLQEDQNISKKTDYDLQFFHKINLIDYKKNVITVHFPFFANRHLGKMEYLGGFGISIGGSKTFDVTKDINKFKRRFDKKKIAKPLKMFSDWDFYVVKSSNSSKSLILSSNQVFGVLFRSNIELILKFSNSHYVNEKQYNIRNRRTEMDLVFNMSKNYKNFLRLFEEWQFFKRKSASYASGFGIGAVIKF